MCRSLVRVGWCFLAAVLFGTAGVRGQGILCTPELLGTYSIQNGSIWSVVVIGDVAYMNVSGIGIQSVDVSDPAHPVSLDALPSEYLSGFVRVDDGMLCAWDYDEGLMFLDVSDPQHMTPLGEFRMFGANEAVFADGLGYVAEGALTVVRVGPDGDAEQISRILEPIYQVVLMDRYAIVTRSSSEIVVFDVADPEAIVEVSHLDIGESVDEMALGEGVLYVFTGGSRFLVVDVADPGQPVVIGTCDLPSDTSVSASVVDGRLYAALSHGGLAVFDLSEPHQPELIGWMDAQGGPRAAIGDGFFLLHAGLGDGVEVYDANDWPTPALRGVVEIAEECTEVVLDGTRAVLSFSTLPAPMQVIDIADPAHPRVVGEYVSAEGYPGYGVAVQDEYAYLARARDPAEIISIAEPDAPTSVGIVGDPDSSFFDFEVHQGVLYGASERHGLVVFDLANPAAPAELSRLRPSFGNIRYIAVGSGVAYLASANRFAVIDISNPEDPRVVQEILPPLPGIERVRVAGDRLLLVGSGVTVYEIHDPLDPVLLGSVDASPELADVFLVGDVAYCAANAGLSVFDLSGSGDPSLIRRLSPIGARLGAGAQRDGLGYFGASSNSEEFVVIGIEPCEGCVADWNGDGTTDSIDFIGFLNAWAAERGSDCSQSDCAADIDENDIVDSRDFIAFLNAWNAGC